MDKLVADITSLINDASRVSNHLSILEQHSQDLLSYHTKHLPDVVVFPESELEVSLIHRYAHEKGIPVIPFGAGTSVEGQIIPITGGICLDFRLMNRIVEVREQDFLVVVQPGVTREQLNQYLKDYGLFFPVDPGANASIGGMTATNASGTQAVRYGNMRENVLGLKVVMADGAIIQTGGKSRKSSAGYNLTNLFVGSEGTLGTFTEITLKVYAIPEAKVAAKIVFENLEVACSFAHELLMYDIPLNKVELLDEMTIKAINQYNKADFIEKPTVLIELGGHERVLDYYLELVTQLLDEYNALHSTVDKQGEKLLWKMRHDVALAILATRPGYRLMTTDVCVPLSIMPEAVAKTREVIDQSKLQGAILGHIGDGNYHAAILIDPTDPDDLLRAQKANEEIVLYALSKGGTCTGEHGVGIGKKGFLSVEHGAGLDVMKLIKNTLDKKNILNPGKVI